MLRSIRFSLGVVALLLTFPSLALAETAPPQVTSPPSTIAPTNRDSRSNSRQVQASPQFSTQGTAQTPPACPAGQFASKFSDVPPNVWAYEAVNRIASGEFRCFPRSSKS